MDSSTDWACLICCELSGFKVFGKCNHPLCLSCVVRQRDLCEQKYCPVCREDLDKVIGVFQFTHGNFEDLEKSCRISGSKPGYKFEDRKVLNAFKELFAMRCQVCKRDCKTVQSLEDHLKREHNKFFCQICKDNLKVFTKDLRVYSKDALRTHRVKGDESDTSMKGHPLCEFCHERFLDNEVLHLHLRKNHFWCHLCDGQAFYCAYADLRLHFQQNHYLCERGECAQEQLTNVFRSPIDLQAHVTSRHVNELGKAQQKQMRQIQPNFTTSRSGSRTRGVYNRGQNERPSSSRMNNIDITDLGNWDETHSSNRGNANRPLKAKPSLGNRPRMRQPPPERQPSPDRKKSHETTSSSVTRDSNDSISAQPPQSANSSNEAGRQKKGGNKNRDRSKSPMVSYRRDENSSQMRPSERSREEFKEILCGEKSDSSSLPASVPSSTSTQSPSVQSVSSSSEVGRPPPGQPAEEPDVGHPPGDIDTPLGDDDDFRRKRGGKVKKSKGTVNAAFPPLRKGGQQKEPAKNTVWGKGAPIQQPLQKSKQSRKQQKTQHADHFDDDLDFQWLDTDQKVKPNSNKEKQKVKKKQTEATTKQSKVPSSSRVEPAMVVAETTERQNGLVDELSAIAQQLSSTSMDHLENRTPSTVAPTSASSDVNDNNSKIEDFPQLAPSVPKASEAHWVPSSRPPQELNSEANYPPLKPSSSKSVLTSSKRSKGRGSRPGWVNKNQAGLNDLHNYPPLSSSMVNGQRQNTKLSAPSVQSAPGSRSASPPVSAQIAQVNMEPAARQSQTPPPDLRTLLNLPKPTDPAPQRASSSVNPPPDFNSIILGPAATSTTEPARTQEPASVPPPDLHSIIMGQSAPKNVPSYDVPTDIPEVSSRLNPSVAPQLTFNDTASPEEDSAPTFKAHSSAPQESAVERLGRPETTSDPEITSSPHNAPEVTVSSEEKPLEAQFSSAPPPGVTSREQSPDRAQVVPETCNEDLGRTDTVLPQGPPGIPSGPLPPPVPNAAGANTDLQLPPGISFVKRNGVPPTPQGPPGFGGPPPGMGSTGVQSRTTIQKSDIGAKFTDKRHLNVPDEENRKTRLMSELRGRLGPMLYTEFENAVKAFNERKMDAPSLAHICRLLLKVDVSDYNSVLEELTVLLPSIQRQNDLYKGLGQPRNLIPCSHCGQIVMKDELMYHTDLHSVAIHPSGLRTNFQNLNQN